MTYGPTLEQPGAGCTCRTGPGARQRTEHSPRRRPKCPLAEKPHTGRVNRPPFGLCTPGWTSQPLSFASSSASHSSSCSPPGVRTHLGRHPAGPTQGGGPEDRGHRGGQRLRHQGEDRHQRDALVGAAQPLRRVPTTSTRTRGRRTCGASSASTSRRASTRRAGRSSSRTRWCSRVTTASRSEVKVRRGRAHPGGRLRGDGAGGAAPGAPLAGAGGAAAACGGGGASSARRTGRRRRS